MTSQFAVPLQQFLAAQQQLRDGLLRLDGQGGARDEMAAVMRGAGVLDQSIVAFQTTLQGLTELPCKEAVDGLVMLAGELADTVPYKAKIKAGPSPGVFPGEHWDALMTSGQAVIAHALANAFDSREQRMAAEKPAFLAVRVRLETGETEDLLEVTDDGVALGMRGPLPATELRVAAEPAATGCRYTVRIPHRAIQRLETYLVIAGGAHRIALPISRVAMVVSRLEVRGRSVVWQDRVLPYLHLADHLDGRAASSAAVPFCAMVKLSAADGADRVIGLGFDRTESVVSAFPRPVPPPLASPSVQALVVDQQGRLALVLELERSFGAVVRDGSGLR